MTAIERLEQLLRARSVRFGDFVLASGRRSSYYIDARLTTLSAEGLGLIGALGLSTIRRAGWAADAVGGLTMGADPVACAIAVASLSAPPHVEAFSVRRAAKEHGTGRRVEGPIAAGAKVVVVEDVITSGRSALEAAAALLETGARVLGVLAVIDREEGGREAINTAGFHVVALTTTSRIIT